MAEETDNNNEKPEGEKAETAMVPDESDPGENPDGLDEKNSEQGRNPDNANSEKGGLFSGKIKKLSLILLALIILTALGIIFGKTSIEGFFHKDDLIDLSLVNKDNLNEKMLMPFVVPLPPDSSSSAVRIDFSVIWDGLASVRFEGRKLYVRDQLYRLLLDLTDKGEDLRTEADFLEQKMTMAFREILQVQNLAVSIKEIQYF